YNLLEERFGGGQTNQAESSAFNANSNLLGGQLGWKGDFGTAGKLTVAAGYFRYNGVQYRNVFWNGGANGNTTVTTGCYYGGTSCLAYGYRILEGIAEYSVTLGGFPLTAYADYAKNSEADDDLVSTAADGLDTALSAGILYGKTGDPRTWEFGFYWQK